MIEILFRNFLFLLPPLIFIITGSSNTLTKPISTSYRRVGWNLRKIAQILLWGNSLKNSWNWFNFWFHEFFGLLKYFWFSVPNVICSLTTASRGYSYFRSPYMYVVDIHRGFSLNSMISLNLGTEELVTHSRLHGLKK